MSQINTIFWQLKNLETLLPFSLLLTNLILMVSCDGDSIIDIAQGSLKNAPVSRLSNFFKVTPEAKIALNTILNSSSNTSDNQIQQTLSEWAQKYNIVRVILILYILILILVFIYDMVVLILIQLANFLSFQNYADNTGIIVTYTHFYIAIYVTILLSVH